MKNKKQSSRKEILELEFLNSKQFQNPKSQKEGMF